MRGIRIQNNINSNNNKNNSNNLYPYSVNYGSQEGLMSNDESLDDIPNTPDDKVSTKLNKMYRKNLR